MFEYIGEMAKDYIYAVTPLLVDAMMERFFNLIFGKHGLVGISGRVHGRITLFCHLLLITQKNS